MVLKDIPPNIWSLGLERVSHALARLDHPERSYRHILVAGTNGKGSTCIYLERILNVIGYRVGTTISPHVNKFTERFRLDGRDIDEKELESIYNDLVPVLGDIGLTYFEWCVILAAVIFKQHQVDFGIFEIGLGGRYDAANALDPKICLITGISLDHTELLGTTIEQIAGEKAAIARKGRPLITTADEPALSVIRQHALECGAVFTEVHTPWSQETSIKGSRQPMNAALAIQAAKALGLNPDRETIRHALKTVFLPGRIEAVGGRIILDVAHNPSSMQELLKYLDQTGFHGVGVFGVLSDKDYPLMIKMLKRTCSVIYIAPVQSERSWRFNDMERFLEAGRVIRCSTVAEAFHMALESDERIVVTGSFYTVGEVRESIVCPGS